MKRKTVEVSCDQCNSAIGHYSPGDVDSDVRKEGGIVTRQGKHFCDKECRSEFLKSKGDRKP